MNLVQRCLDDKSRMFACSFDGFPATDLKTKAQDRNIYRMKGILMRILAALTNMSTLSENKECYDVHVGDDH